MTVERSEPNIISGFRAAGGSCWSVPGPVGSRLMVNSPPCR